MEKRGVKLKKQVKFTKTSGFFVLKPPKHFTVPLLTGGGDQSDRVVNIGDKVCEGSLIAKPVGKYGSFIYSPCSGKVVGVVRKLNARGYECDHVVITRDLEEDREYLKPLDVNQFSQEFLLKRVYESGLVDNFEPYDPTYKKYLLKNPIKTLVVDCCEDDPYVISTSVLIDNYVGEIVEGAKYLKIVAQANEIVFTITTKQRAIYKKLNSHIKNLGDKNIKIKVMPDIYPLNHPRIMSYYITGKMVADGQRTAITNVIVESANNCYDFYNAVNLGMPAIQRAVTVAGDNCIRKANYFIKNGTSISHVLDVVTVRDGQDNKLVYGGIMTGIAQENLDISVSLDATAILFCNNNEVEVNMESACINCGKCNECCPVRLNVKELDQIFYTRDYSRAKNLGCETCIKCGACSYICPAKRYLTQRVSFMKDYVSGKRAKNPSSGEYVLIEGESGIENESLKDKISLSAVKFESVEKNDNINEIEQMLSRLEDVRHYNEREKQAQEWNKQNGVNADNGGEK